MTKSGSARSAVMAMASMAAMAGCTTRSTATPNGAHDGASVANSSVTSDAAATNASTASPAVSVATAADADADAGALVTIAGLDAASFGITTAPRAPSLVVVHGYPHPLRNGMNDIADFVGWTKDGTLFGYCVTIAARDPASENCEFQRADHTVQRLSSDNQAGDFVAANKKAIDAFLRDNQVPNAVAPAPPDPTGGWANIVQPKLVATWRYPDMTLEIERVASSDPKAPDGPSPPAFVRAGGAVDGEAPVYPVSLLPPSSNSPYNAPHFAVMNGMSLSPDQRDIGFVAHFFTGEWGDLFTVERMSVDAFASRVYNDTGFRHHQEKDYGKAAQYFAKSAFADGDAKLPPYNLACALARLNDPRAEAALREAIRRGGDDVKKRAAKDADFASLRAPTAAPWFTALIGT